MPKTFPKQARLYGRGTFKAIRDERVKHDAGPLVFHAGPSAGRSQLGISIGRPVGTAARRNRIKRLLREAFRLTRDAWPAAYDVVVTVRPHEPRTAAEYQAVLTTAIAKLHERWSKRA